MADWLDEVSVDEPLPGCGKGLYCAVFMLGDVGDGGEILGAGVLYLIDSEENARFGDLGDFAAMGDLGDFCEWARR